MRLLNLFFILALALSFAGCTGGSDGKVTQSDCAREYKEYLKSEDGGRMGMAAGPAAQSMCSGCGDVEGKCKELVEQLPPK